MKFFEKLLVFYNDKFGDIIEDVIGLIRKNGSNLTIIDVFDNFDQHMEFLPPLTSIEELKKVVISEHRLKIMQYLDAFPDISSQVKVLFKFGSPAVEIIKEAIRGEYDLVVKAATGNRSLKERLFGNVAVKLFRKCPCPVLIIKPKDTISFKKILAPIDPDNMSQQSNIENNSEKRISKKIMDIATSMARLVSSQLDILHCWMLPGETLLSSGRTRIDPENFNYMLKMAEKIHKQKINDLVAEYDLSDIKYSVIALKGDPGNKIVEFAEMNEIDLIIMGTVGRSGLAGLLIGSTAEKVVDRVNCSVLTVKPVNFKSPIIL